MQTLKRFETNLEKEDEKEKKETEGRRGRGIKSMKKEENINKIVRRLKEEEK